MGLLDERGPVPRPQFISRSFFKTAVELAAREGRRPETYLGPGPYLVHPEAVEWLLWRGPQGRMCSHFSMLDE